MVGNAMTREELIAKARQLAAAGNVEAAKRAMAMAQGMSTQQQPQEDIKPNPDGTYGQPPEGFITDPRTGAMTSRELLANNIDPNAVTSAAKGAQQGLSFGFGDEVQGAMTAALPGLGGTVGERYAFGREYARAQEDAARRNNPAATAAGELGGALATALMPVGAGGQLAGRAGQVAPRVAAAASRAPRASRMAGSMAAGAGMGGLYGFGAGEGGVGPRAKSAAAAAMLGGATGAAVPLVGAGVQKGLNARAGRKAIRDAARAGKTTEEVYDEGRALYKAIDDAGIQVKPESAIRGYGEAAVDLGEKGASRTYTGNVEHPTPRAAAMYQMAKARAEEAAQSQGIPWRDIDLDSQVFRNTANSNRANRPDTTIAQGGSGKFENWMLGLTPDDVASGDPSVVAENLPKAREAWSRARKSEMIDDAIEQGQNYLSGGASGIKNRFKSILRNPKLSGQLSEAEKAAMRRVIDGTPAEKLVDTFGSGLGQMATMATGGAVGSSGGIGGGLAGTLVGAGVGQGARRASEAIAARNAEIARAAIASGKLTGNLPQVSPEVRAIIEQLMRGGMTPAVGN